MTDNKAVWQRVRPVIERYFSANCTPVDEAALAALATADLRAEYPSRTLQGRDAWLAHVMCVYRCFLWPCLKFSHVAPDSTLMAADDIASMRLTLVAGTLNEWQIDVPWTLETRPAACCAIFLCCFACRSYWSTGVNTFRLRETPDGDMLVSFVRTVAGSKTGQLQSPPPTFSSSVPDDVHAKMV